MQNRRLLKRRIITGLSLLGLFLLTVALNPKSYNYTPVHSEQQSESIKPDEHGNASNAEPTEGNTGPKETQNNPDKSNATNPMNSTDTSNSKPLASEVLSNLEVKGRAPKTGYKRTEFYKNWPEIEGCNLRQRILKRDFGETAKTDKKCNVISGSFYEPYTGTWMSFSSREEIGKKIQIDHIVALSDAWQKGAQYLSSDIRFQIATDPLNLAAVDGPANQQKSDSDAASWLPKNKSFRCQYVARQISVKKKYNLWVTEAEKSAMSNVLGGCPEQRSY